MVDRDILDPQYQDYKALEDSTVIHIRGLKLQLEIAYASLKRATECRKATQEPEDIPEPATDNTIPDGKVEFQVPEAKECESTKTEEPD